MIGEIRAFASNRISGFFSHLMTFFITRDFLDFSRASITIIITL